MVKRRLGDRLWLLGILVLAGVLLIAVIGCGEKETTTTTAPATTASTTAVTTAPTQTTASSETTTTAPQPVAGGRYVAILQALPQVLGYYPETGPGDQLGLTPGMERLARLSPDRKLVPILAESWEEDVQGLKVTVHLRKGVKFHDGTALTANVAKWNLELYKQTGKLMWGNYVDSIEVVDDTTFVVHLNNWNNLVLRCILDAPMLSQEAFEKNGLEWARVNFVGTGPFKLKTFNRDQNMIWEKNPDYWGKDQGLPYLDEVEFMYLSDMNTAKAAMEAKEADSWTGADSQMLSEMQKKGFVLQGNWAGLYGILIPNLVDEKTPVHDQRVRDAIDYAIDREALAEALGYGMSIPCYEMAPPGEFGAGGAKVKREYNPEKAKQLLAEAGYPNGCPIDILAVVQAGGRNSTAEAIKGYLDAAGFQTNLDIADVGRYYGSAFGTGWKDLILGFYGVAYGQTDFNDLVNFWSQYNAAFVPWFSWKATPELAKLFDEGLKLTDPEALKKKCEEIIDVFAQQNLTIPLLYTPSRAILQPWVHTDVFMASLTDWDWAHTWKEAH